MSRYKYGIPYCEPYAQQGERTSLRASFLPRSIVQKAMDEPDPKSLSKQPSITELNTRGAVHVFPMLNYTSLSFSILSVLTPEIKGLILESLTISVHAHRKPF